MRRAEKMREFPYLKLPRPRLVRHTIPEAALLRWTLVLLRFSVPFFVFYFDTYIFFNVFSAVFSSSVLSSSGLSNLLSCVRRL